MGRSLYAMGRGTVDMSIHSVPLALPRSGAGDSERPQGVSVEVMGRSPGE
jgi:hypothetical protein